MAPVLSSVRTRTILCVSVGALCGDYSGIHAFSVVSIASPRAALHLKGVVYDDFASYSDERSNEAQEAQALTQEFYHELMIRNDLATAMADVDTNDLTTNTQGARKASGTAVQQPQFSSNPRAMQSAGFFNAKKKTKVYSVGRNSRGSEFPLPPKPTYGSPTNLSIPGIIAVALLSRYFWVQALVSIGLIALYFLLVAATSNGGAEWLGASLGGSTNMDWSSAVNDGMPVIERSATTTFMDDGEGSASL